MKKKFTRSIRVMTSCLTAGMMMLAAACGEDPIKPDPEPGPGPGPDEGEDKPEQPEEVIVPLKNQFALDKDTIDIRTALWEKDNAGSYQIYMTPRTDVIHYEDLEKTDDYLTIKVNKIGGKLDVAADEFHIGYKDFDVFSENASSMDSLYVSVEMNGNSLIVDFHAGKGNRCLAAKYDGSVSKIKPMKLINQWELDRNKTSIGSVVESRTDGFSEFYLYTEKDITTLPEENGRTEFVRISLPEDLTGEIDIAAEKENIDIVYKNLSLKNAEEVSGTLKVMTDKTGKQLTIQLESMLDNTCFRIAWTGYRNILLDIERTFSLTTIEGEETTVGLNTVFIEKDRVQTNRVAFGLAENPQTWEDLKDRYAVQFNISSQSKEINLATDDNFSLQIFDYANYETYNAGDYTPEGYIKWVDDPNGNENAGGFIIDAALSNGMKIYAEWFGEFTLADRFDLKPVAPFAPHITITAKDGTVISDLDITELQVRDNPDFQCGISGAMFPAKEFYFVNENTAYNGVDADEATPVLTVNTAFIGEEDVDLSTITDVFEFRYKPFNASGIASPGSWNGGSQKASMSVIEKENGDWSIRLSILDFGNWWGWGDPTGTESTIVIEWEGPASPYTGSKK